MSLAYTLTFLISNVPYVTFELILAFDKQHVLGPTVTAIIGKGSGQKKKPGYFMTLSQKVGR